MFSLFNKLTGRGDAPAEPAPASAGVSETSSAASASASAAAAVAEPPAGAGLNVDALLAPSPAPVAAEPAFGPVDAERTETLKPAIVAAIGTVFDPEIPVNIYELGLIYEIAADAQSRVRVLMTLTSPACPSAQQLPSEVRYKVKAARGRGRLHGRDRLGAALDEGHDVRGREALARHVLSRAGPPALVQQRQGVRTVPGEHVGERAAGLVGERRVRELESRDAIEAEAAEVLPELAPAGEQPVPSPEEEPERTDEARGGVAVRLAVVEGEASARNEPCRASPSRSASASADAGRGGANSRVSASSGSRSLGRTAAALARMASLARASPESP